jgi:hypothetical protein
MNTTLNNITDNNLENDIINNNLENEISNLNQYVNNLQIPDDIINFKYKINNTIFSYVNHIEKLRKIIETIDIKLEKECNHNWQRDYTYYGEHSQYQCSKCYLYK